MKTVLAFLLFSPIAAFAAAGSLAGRLDFVDDPTVNNLIISLTFSGISDDDISRLTGHLDVEVVLGEGGAPNALSITGGRFHFSDTSFVFRSGFFTLGTAQAAGLTGTILTPEPPAPVEADGAFDASFHEFTIDGGTMVGKPWIGDPFTADFADAPSSGPGSGTGQLSAVPEGSGWLVTIDFPVLIQEITDADGIEVIVEVEGTLRASGVLGGNGSGGFADWVATLEPPLPGASAGLLDRNGPFAVPNLLFYATGLHPLSGDSPRPVLEIQGRPDPVWVVTHRRRRNAPDVELRLTGTPSPEDAASWQPLPVLSETVSELDGETERVESVLNLPAGAPAWFLRLEAAQLP